MGLASFKALNSASTEHLKIDHTEQWVASVFQDIRCGWYPNQTCKEVPANPITLIEFNSLAEPRMSK